VNDPNAQAVRTGTTKDTRIKHAFIAKISSVLTLIGIVVTAYLLFARPSQLRWGATDAEVARIMPGDALSDHPTFLSTRAITINATPEIIWPWLVQMGYGRAGFYGYDIIENIGSARGIRSADHMVPELQHIAVGDPLPLSAAGGLVFNAIAPNRYLVWSGAKGPFPGGFTWALYPIDASHTRLVSRIQWSHHWTQPLLLIMDLFTEFTDHLAVRKILHGVKERVEGHVESFARQTFEFVILVWAFVAFLVSIWLVLRRPLTSHRWRVTLIAGAAWLVVWYASIPLWLCVAVNGIVILILRMRDTSNIRRHAL